MNRLKKYAMHVVQRAGPYIEAGSEIADSIVHIPRGASKAQIAAVAVKAAKSGSSLLVQSAGGHSGWCDAVPYFGGLERFLGNLLSERLEPVKAPSPGSSHMFRLVYDLGGAEVRTETMPDDMRVEARAGQGVEVRRALGRLVWEARGPRLRYIVQRDGALVPWQSRPIASNAARGVYARLEAYQGEARSVLLYGPPGSGKSCMAHWAAEQLGGPCLAVDAVSLSSMSSAPAALYGLVELLRPRALVVDDIDRLSDSAALLSSFEEIRAPGTVLIATANDVTMLDRAILRPGRFDEIVKVDGLGADVADALLDPIPRRYRERVRDWGAAYLSELGRRAGRCSDHASIEAEIESLERHIELEASAQVQQYRTRREGA